MNASPVWRGSSTITTFADYRAAVERRFRSPATPPTSTSTSPSAWRSSVRSTTSPWTCWPAVSSSRVGRCSTCWPA
ncbi:hypothetical protein NKG94_39925 [Micromonospora sp. M12]